MHGTLLIAHRDGLCIPRVHKPSEEKRYYGN